MQLWEERAFSPTLKYICQIHVDTHLSYLPSIYHNSKNIQDLNICICNSQQRCTNQLFCEIFADNCMKMKEFGP